MSAVLAIMALLAGQGTAQAQGSEGFAADATEWLLDGRALPDDWKLQLQAMEPAERLQSLIFLRRSGLLTTQVWTVDDLLAPAVIPPQIEETR